MQYHELIDGWRIDVTQSRLLLAFTYYNVVIIVTEHVRVIIGRHVACKRLVNVQ